jgi:hypothetical protein
MGLRALLLWLIACHSNISFASDVALYSPQSLATNPLSIQLQSAFSKDANIIIHKINVNPGTVVVGAGRDFLKASHGIADIYCLAVLPYSASQQPNKREYHLYFHVTPSDIDAFLSQQFDPLKVGFIYFDEHDPFYQYAATKTNVEFIGRKVSNDVFDGVRRLREIDKIDIFLITNDTRLYSSKVLRFLLEDMYRQNVPVIALNQQLLKAGASIAFVPKIDEFARQTLSIAQRIRDKLDTPFSQFSNSFEVIVNQPLLKRFDIQLKEVSKHEK